ncbi:MULTISPECIES: hypothetical protein [unclassified Methylobacterium]|uniref:hypothetical protein n=1 Tax=unclassified Methylobacterium TaxID=2615210 RepID=UPI00226AFA4A|nr:MULTISPECIES: hypothetical protein [unclassified Methylobacterium]
MKPNAMSESLAARLTSAAATPLPLPKRPQEPANSSVAPEPVADPEPAAVREPVAASTRGKAKAVKADLDTIGITLRPSRSLMSRYVNAAADRTKATGRVVSAQQLMLEQLEKGPAK